MSKLPLVLLPPIMCDARVYGPQFLALSPFLTLIHAPTTGGERAEEIASDILNGLPQKFALAGTGMGAYIALEMVRRAPERIEKLALISAFSHGATPESASERDLRIVAARSSRFDDVIPEELSSSWLARSSERLKISQSIKDMAHNQGVEAYVRQSRALQRRRDLQPFLHQIRKPVSIVIGKEDTPASIKRQDFIAEMIPDAAMHRIEEAGYLPSLEQPEVLSEFLMDFAQAR